LTIDPKAVTATGWSAVEIIVRQTVQFAIVVALARLLTPADFGVYALLALFLALAGVFVDSGMGSALIHRQDVTSTDQSTVFWFNIVVAVVMAAILVVAAPWLAQFYAQPALVTLTWILSFSVIVAAFGSIHRTILTKQLDFKRLTVIGLGSTIVGGGTAIFLAWHGFGVLTLAIQALAGSVTSTLLLWVFSRWRPDFVFSLASARSLFGYGGYWLGVQLLNNFYLRLNTVLIGKFHGPEALGYFSRGETTAALPASVVSSIFARVAFPAFSQISSDRTILRNHVRMTLRSCMLLNAPVMLGLLAVADPMVSAVFGEVWQPSVPFVQILCLSRLFTPMFDINLLVFMSTGRSRTFFLLECMAKLTGITGVALAVPYGMEAVAWATVGGAWLGNFLITYNAGKRIGYHLGDQLRDLRGPTALSLAMVCALMLFDSFLGDIAAGTRLMLEVLLGFLFFTGIGSLLELSVFGEARAIIAGSRSDRS
jgi:O-antigen/teichoic acid export membrane protein